MLAFGPYRVPCALGRSGVRTNKREGDGATPRGRFYLLKVLFNPRGGRVVGGGLPIVRIAPHDGWCDDPTDRNYNRPVRHPYPASAERMLRTDDLYDIVVVLSHNVRPRVRGRGSAVFLHIAREDFRPTEGCVAIRKADMRRIVPMLRRGTAIVIEP